MSPYEIAWTAPARRAISTMPGKVATAAVEFIYGAPATSPRRAGKALRLDLEGLRSARRGDYRVVYRVDDGRRRVEIIGIEHRADVYRPGRWHG